MVLRIHPVADLTPGKAVPEQEPEPAGISGEAEVVQPSPAVIELVVDIRNQVFPASWTAPAHISGQGRNLVVYQTPKIQDAVASHLEKLRASPRR